MEFFRTLKRYFLPAKNILAADSAYWQAGYSQVLPRSSRAAFFIRAFCCSMG